MADDVGDEKKVKHKKSVRQLEREREIAELHAILQTYGGRSFIHRLLAEAKMFHFGFTGPVLEQMEGRRGVGWWVYQEVFTADPKAYTLMLDEAASRDTKQKPEGKDDG